MMLSIQIGPFTISGANEKELQAALTLAKESALPMLAELRELAQVAGVASVAPSVSPKGNGAPKAGTRASVVQLCDVTSLSVSKTLRRVFPDMPADRTGALAYLAPHIAPDETLPLVSVTARDGSISEVNAPRLTRDGYGRFQLWDENSGRYALLFENAPAANVKSETAGDAAGEIDLGHVV